MVRNRLSTSRSRLSGHDAIADFPIADHSRVVDQDLKQSSVERFRDLSTLDALLAAGFGIIASEASSVAFPVARTSQIATAMLVAGLFAAVRLCWPMRRYGWLSDRISLVKRCEAQRLGGAA
jgi:hypothetical protein